MRRKKLLFILVLILAAGLCWLGYQVFGPVVSSPEKKYFYIPTGSTYTAVEQGLKEQNIISNSFFFNLIAKQLKYPGNVKAGRYEIKNGSNVINLVRMLKSGRQSPVKLVITKLRTRDDFAKKIGDNFETSKETVLEYINSTDSLKPWGLTPNSFMTAVMPNTYQVYWNTSLPKILDKLKTTADKFWNEERLSKAKQKKLTPQEVYAIASIVDEETNKAEDKGLVASVYINRVRMGMKLQADPTVKFALNDFTLKRILYSHLTYPSPYNTYYTTGLPPGPISTALPSTIDAVLDAPDTHYVFFAAKPDFKGGHSFAETYAEHKVNARAYQKALDSIILLKQQKQQQEAP